MYLTREQWGAPPLRGNALLTTSPSNRRGFATHWDGGQTPKTEADEIRLLKAYHNYHNTPTRGGFPYNLAVGPVTGNVYEGRGLHRIGAAVGGHNTAVISVIVIGGPGNFTAKAKEGLKQAYALANTYAGRTLTQGVHADYNVTSCAGPDWNPWVRGGNLSGGTLPDTGIPAGGAGSKYKPGDVTVRGVSVKMVQDRLIAHNPKALPKWGADGKMGDETIAAIRAFQSAEKIAVDGIVGSVTWARLEQDPKGPLQPTTPPAWPLAVTEFFGPEGLGADSVSGHHGHQSDLRVWHQQMRDRGWRIGVDGLASRKGETNPLNTETGKVARAFQREKGLTAHGLVDRATWDAAWAKPIT